MTVTFKLNFKVLLPLKVRTIGVFCSKPSLGDRAACAEPLPWAARDW